MELDTQRIEELYKSGLGIKLVAQKTGASPSQVKRLLVRSGVYQGAERSMDTAAAIAADPLPALAVEAQFLVNSEHKGITHPYGDPTDPLTWTPGDQVRVEVWQGGWILDFRGKNFIRCALPPMDKEFCWQAPMRLLAPERASFVLALGDATGEERLDNVLYASHDPRGSIWRLWRTIGDGGFIEIRSRDTVTGVSTIFLSDIQFSEVKNGK